MRKGFTLVELLAVIVILAIILAIAIPGISNIINSSTKGAAESDAKIVLDAIRIKAAEDSNFDPTTINETNVESLLGISDDNYERLTIKKMNNQLFITAVGKNKWNNLTVSGTKTNTKVSDTVTDFVRGANAPALVTGMTPIKWNGSAWVDTITDDTEWYNYDTTNKIWANARTADGSMWVWIPRYIYRIPTANWHTNVAGTIDVQFTKGVDDNWNKASIGLIDIGETANASNNKWTNHPAFTFGDTELTGIWVAKFQASSSNPSAANGGGYDSTLKVRSLPNITQWRSISIDIIFTVTRAMEKDNTYGWGTTGNGIDTHMMKNTEWGAVAYLSKSIYGKNDEMWYNPAFTTGCAGDSVTAGTETTCLRTYDTPNGQQASATGNIYGIYDMSGDVTDYVAAYINNGNSSLAYGSKLIKDSDKYKNVYKVGITDSCLDNYNAAISSKGDAVYETSSNVITLGTGWYNGDMRMPNGSSPFFIRGLKSPFSIGNYLYGQGTWFYSFRPTIAISSGL